MVSSESSQAGPLSGLRVLDLSRVLSGPYCALLLGEMGAEVIKIEKPGRGDHSRRPRGNGPADIGLRYLAWNMFRKSVTLNIWTPEGADIFKELVAKSDVIIENFRPNVMAKAGLDFATLRAINPGIIMASISGFGQDTSLSQYTAHASVISAFTGVQHMNRFGDSPPTPTPGASPDISAGTIAAIGILAALYGRNATGQGRHVDVSMVDSMVGQVAYDLMYALITGESAPERDLRSGDGPPSGRFGPAFHQCYQAKDGWFYLQADLSAQWERLAIAIGRPDLIEDPLFSTEKDRAANRDALDDIFQDWLKDRTKEEAFAILGGAGVPCSPAYTPVEVANHPYLKERGMLRTLVDPRLGELLVLTPRIQFRGEQPAEPTPAPQLGEHTDEILGGLLGYEAEKVAGLREKGVV